MSNSDASVLDDFIFQTPSGDDVKIISSSQSSGEGEVHLRFKFVEEVKTVSVIAKSYSELKSDMVPVHKRIGFSGELKAE